ncbi:Bromodomain transcription factor [Raphanus sativus]|uniref:Transcription initiation factor TFIID subunit 8 n=1 Tax=Raphanus sativus TaxID=3726 RepID=A0A6J0P2E6_RAPSA|nr:transcription initiation factor TFIID subunit 8 [Raphanus sativus]KAJ4916972.1 Bromodomain transcription factor [Raphanus sativus]
MKRRRKARVNSEAPPDDQSAAEFSFTLTKVAVSQICLSVGYTSTDTSSTLNTLTLITTKFLQSIAELAASFSNSANRTEANLFDIVNGLQDAALATSDCFPGGSTLHSTESHCLIRSAVLRNLSDFVASAFEIPFAKPLPRLEISGSYGGDSTRAARSRDEMKSIPAWLPPFPEDSSLYRERYAEERSGHLWEKSDSVIGHGTFVEETSGFESCRGRSGGRLPMRRASVRFKVERDWSNGGGGKSDTRLERWRDKFEVKKRIGEEEEYIDCADIDAGEWNM